MKDLQFTRAYLKNSVSKRLGLFLLLCLCFNSLFAANVLGRPRKMFLIKTEHFDIIYSKESEETALVLVEQSDLLYAKAAEKLNSKINRRMPVIISPDSDELSVDYTAYPYNRIIIFDSPANYDTALFEDTLLSLFYREVYMALVQSIRDPFNQFISKWLVGEEYQPVALFNMPYSFIEGNAYLAESEEAGQGRLNDGYFLQILAQAKLENKFPKWTQIIAVRDTYPGEELAYAAGAGFAAFLMNTYGVEKYAQLWQESGKLNPLLTRGVFLKTYEITLNELWTQFEASVPLPENLIEAETDKRDREANYEHLLITEYGTVWYDRIRHEVDIFDKKNSFKMRQLLFLADNVERMSLSPDGRYLSVSYSQARQMEGLSSYYTWIFDLKKRRFLDARYELRDASIVTDSNGRMAVAGVNVKDSLAKLEVYTLPADDAEDEDIIKLYECQFERNRIPFSPVYAGDGYISYILAEGNARFLCRFSFEGNGLESKWIITDSASSPLRIQQLAWSPASDQPFYTFSFTRPGLHSFTRTGFIYLTDFFEPESVKLASADVSGGMNYATLSPKDQAIVYSSKKFDINQLARLPFSDLPLEDGSIQKTDIRNEVFYSNQFIPETALSDYQIRRYNPFKYMLDFSFLPFFSLKQIDLTEGNFYWPGLGLTIESQTDPCSNTRMLLSGGWTYLPLDFSWTSNIPSSYVAKVREESQDISKDKSAAFYLENSSTPVFLRAGTIFNCNLDGEYTLKLAAGGQWSIPLGIALRRLIFDVQYFYSISTDYYDQTQAELRPSLADWPSLEEAYALSQLSMKVQYTNIHQYGYSVFEKRGLTLGLRIYSMWDMYEVKLLRQAREEQEANEKISREEELTNAQQKNLLSDSMEEITQLNAGFFATIAIPRLNPLHNIKNLVISMPALLKAEFVNKAGTALEASSEVLLIGYEMHDSIIPAVLYTRRAGLWFGYNMALVYNTAEVRLPDIRHENYLAEVFTDISYNYAFYMILNLDLNITLGKLSAIPINTTLTGSFFPQSKGYQISLDVKLHL